MSGTDVSVAPDVRIKAEPTKDFFISMLVKDIHLTRAIIDLVDNALDGARRMRPDQADYEGLWVRVEASEDRFEIVDNCGGMDVDTARRYAFRFGRAEGMPTVPHSVGHFGVGMKRALFKLGKRFAVTSTTDTSRFSMEVDVEEWNRDADTWEFQFCSEPIQDGSFAEEERGTHIEVTQLHRSVAGDFARDTFRSRLGNEIAAAHVYSISKGLAITLNGRRLEAEPLQLLESHELKAACREIPYGGAESRVSVKLYAGIAKQRASEAGWYVFCNERLVLGADQSITTGWGEGEGRTIPKFHGQFAMFRGYALFDAQDAALLPWNTTKTGVDVDSPVFKRIRVEMLTMMRPVIDFLNKLDKEKELPDEKPLSRALEAAQPKALDGLSGSERFVFPKVRTEPPPRKGRILYSKPNDEIDMAKNRLNVKTNKAVGEKTFEYYLRMECDA